MANIAAAVERGLSWAVPATRQERAAALWSFGYFFALLAGYYVLRPLRDQMGIAGGVRNLPWLFTATFVALIGAQPLYGALVAKLPRARFIPLVYQFFVANLALFWLLLTLGVAPVIVARVFFVWVSVFSLFAVAVFWSFMADLFTAEQGKRLFGFIGAGGTAGGLLGPLITIQLSKPLGSINLLIAAAVLLEIAVFCVYRLERAATVHDGPDDALHAAPQRIGPPDKQLWPDSKIEVPAYGYFAIPLSPLHEEAAGGRRRPKEDFHEETWPHNKPVRGPDLCNR